MRVEPVKNSRNRQIATGFLSLSTSKILFMISGFAIYFSLPRLMSADSFGNYGVTMGFLSTFNMMLVVGTIQAVSKFVSEQPGNERLVRLAAFRIQSFIGGGVSLILFFAAPVFAGFFNDPALIPPFRLGAPIPALYAYYAVVMGSLNGRGLFHGQAKLDIIFAFLKTVMIILGAWIMGTVFGAIAGFTLTALIITIIGLLSVDSRPAMDPEHRELVTDHPRSRFTTTKLLKFELSVMILTLFSNLLINLDLFLVKALAPSETASELAGYYTAVQTFARIPYVLVVALALVMFPLISSSSFARDKVQCRKYIKATFRFPLVIIAPIAIFLSAFAADCLAVVYPEPYMSAAPALVVLAVAELMLAMFYLATTIINGSGNPVFSIVATVVGIGSHGLACLWLIPRFGLIGAAWGSMTGWSIGFLFCALYLLRKFHTLVRPLTVLRTVLAMAVTWGALLAIPMNGLSGLIAGFIICIVIYWSILVITRELTLGELKNLISKFR